LVVVESDPGFKVSLNKLFVQKSQEAIRNSKEEPMLDAFSDILLPGQN